MPGEKDIFEKLGYITAQVEKIPEIQRDLKGLSKDVNDLMESKAWAVGWASGVSAITAFLVVTIRSWFGRN